MREKIMVLLLLSIFTFLLAGKNADSKQKNTRWKQIKNRHEILISSRWSNTSIQFKEIKAETYIRLPKDKLLEIIQSGVYTSEWMAMVENYYVKQGISKNQWESQLNLNLFWPLSKNNLEINYNLLNDCEDSSFIMFSSKKVSVLNKTVKPGVYQFRGSWELIPLSNNETKVILKTKWDKKNVLQQWYFSPIISDGMFTSLKNLKHFSEEKYNTERLSLAATDF